MPALDDLVDPSIPSTTLAELSCEGEELLEVYKSDGNPYLSTPAHHGTVDEDEKAWHNAEDALAFMDSRGALLESFAELDAAGLHVAAGSP